MKRLFQRITVSVAVGGAAVLLLGAACYLAGVRINTTKSVPVGVYWAVSTPVRKGDYVIFCPPRVGVFDEAKARGYISAGFCPGGYGYLMKRVLAAKDDTVSVGDEGVRVNGELLPLSAPLRTDKGGRLMPRYQARRFTLGASELLLMSDVSPTSFDGRYFGPINRSQLRTVVRPVLTW